MQSYNNSKASNITRLAMLTAIALLCGYIEYLIPFNFGIPGIKLGLANLITVYALYDLGYKDAFIVNISRIILTSLLFGSFYSFFYSLIGGMLSLTCMWIFKKLDFFYILGVSIIGGITHNLGQLLLAIFIVRELKVAYYTPVLLLSGTITGALMGILTQLVYSRVSGIKGD